MSLKKPTTAPQIFRNNRTMYLKQSQFDDYEQLQRINPIGFKGKKTNLAQYRQKKQLKFKIVNTHNKSNKFMDIFNNKNYSSADEDIKHLNNMESQYPQNIDDSFYQKYIGTQSLGQKETNHLRRNPYTADAESVRRKKMKQLQNQIIMKEQSKTMVVKTKKDNKNKEIMKAIIFFNSQNLGRKMNEKMNMEIREPNRATQRSKELKTKQDEQRIKASNQRKLSPFERRLKSSRRLKSKITNYSQLRNTLTLDHNQQVLSTHKEFKMLKNCKIGDMVIKHIQNNLKERQATSSFKDRSDKISKNKFYQTIQVQDSYRSPLMSIERSENSYTKRLAPKENFCEQK